MTLGEIVSTLAFIAEREGKAKKLTISDLNRLFKLVDYDFIRENFGHPDQPTGYETQGQISEALLPIKTEATVTLTSGVGTIPNDFYHFVDSYYTSGASTIRISEVRSQESVAFRSSSINAPTTTYPIIEVWETQVKVYPTTGISSIKFVYLKRPTPAVYAVKTENGIQVYDSASSTQFEWTADKHIDIIRLLLKYIGISLGNLQIAEYVNQKEAVEN